MAVHVIVARIIFAGLVLVMYATGFSWLSIAALLLAGFVFRFFYSVYLYPTFFTPLKYLPTPEYRSWIKGNVNSVFADTLEQRFCRWANTIPNDGLIRYYAAGNLERVLVTKPEGVREILTSNSYAFQKPRILKTRLGQIAGDGLLFAEGDEHKMQRKAMMPAFAFRHIKNLYPIFWSKTQEAIREMEKDIKTSDGYLEMNDWAYRIILDIIGLAGMDFDFGSVQDANNELNGFYRKLINASDSKMFKLISLVGIYTIGLENFMRIPFKETRMIREASNNIRNVTRKVIQENKGNEKAGGGEDIIAVTVASGAFSDHALVDHMMTMLGAGHETTANTLQYAFFALCKYPDVQVRLRNEVRADVAISTADREKSDSISANVIDSLVYLNAFVNEVLRLYPSIPLVGRAAVDDTTVMGMRIPKDTHLIICTQLTNQSEELWGPDASEFNPDRWLAPGASGNGGAKSNFAFSTFSHGPRACIGQAFARSELACVIAALVAHFKMEFKEPDIELVPAYSLVSSYPSKGVKIKCTVLED